MRLVDRLLSIAAPSRNGRGHEAKAAPVSFIPRDASGGTIEAPFVISNSGRVSRNTAFAVAVYAYAAIMWRAEKYSEPALYVGELGDDDEFAWLPDHELAEVLDVPSPDYDMGELLMLTRMYRDVTGAAIWVKDLDRSGRVRRLVPFSADEFSVEAADGRIYGRFRVMSAAGQQTLPPERVVYFREPYPGDWYAHLAPLDVALRSLSLGEQATETVRAVLKNALFPSVIIQTDPAWQPSDEEWERFKDQIRQYARIDRKGEPLALTGGGKASVVSLSIQQLLPSEILNRVEATVAAAFRVPPIVLQFLVGLENSPWSQMQEARRGATQDLLVPMWARDQRKLTAQLLRAPVDAGRPPLDPHPRREIRFDLGPVAALQPDRASLAEMAQRMERFARVRDLRQIVGLEPLDDDDPRNDVIPGLQPPAPAVSIARPAAEEEERSAPIVIATKADLTEQQKDVAWHRFDAATKAQEPAWRAAVAAQLERDREEIARLAAEYLGAAKQSPVDPTAFLRELARYLSGPALETWRRVVEPLIGATGEAAVTQIAAELGVAWDMLQPGLADYVQREAAWLIRQVTDTTRQAVRDALQAGLEAGETIDQLAARIRASDAAFGPARAELIARTETTRVYNGAQVESLTAWAAEIDARVTKTWLTVRDGRVRDEHRALDGVTVGIRDRFPNGLLAPGEPNCRCTLLYEVVED